jgi:PTS system N-acetylgalactosamine-specific IIA component
MSDGTARALVAGHADFAVGMISAVEQITGQGATLVPIQVRDLGSADIQQVLYAAMMKTGARVIFTDLQAGSCTMAARRVLREIGAGVLVAGTNLPMLLDFALSTNANAAEAATSAAERGRVAVTVHTGSPA